MSVPKLDFTNGNNSALSLRLLAELCRRGDALVLSAEPATGADLVITLRYTAQARKARPNG
jgi:hypothetical protein